MLSLAIIIEALTGVSAAEIPLLGGVVRPTDVLIPEAVIDSRRIIPGALFIALPGEKSDGHDYVRAAFDAGAALAIVQQSVPELPELDLRHGLPGAGMQELPPDGPLCLRVGDSLKALQQIARVWRIKLNLEVIGITGSVGKSTTKEAVADVMEQRFHTLRNEGNLNNEIGLPLSILRATEQHRRAVLEMGFYVPGEISFLCEIARPRIGIVTNIGTVHAERAGTQEAIARGKSELVQALPKNGTAILNYDDAWVRGMAQQTQASVFFYGRASQADLWVDQIEGLGLEGMRLCLHYRDEVIPMHIPALGYPAVDTVLRAAAAGLVDGLTWNEIKRGLVSGRTQLRMSAARNARGALILDDTYNAAPESTLAALNLLADLKGRKVAVLGDMLELGPYEEEGHVQVGKRTAEVAEVLVTVGSRARTIARTARQEGMPLQRITEYADSEQAAEGLANRFQGGDVVLVKGSHGVHMETIVAVLEVEG
jgi:UDP-N-acetylmuramoyl-tripeptide--D-alanyl-D-alanine ligase